MFPSAVQSSNVGAIAASTSDRFADPSYRARVREQAVRLKELSTLPAHGKVPAVVLLRRMDDMKREWQHASGLGFRLTQDDQSRFRRAHEQLDVYNELQLAMVAMDAYGLSESMARAMDARLPPAERLNVEWSPPKLRCGGRLDSGTISVVHAPGGRTWIQDSRILQFQRTPID